MGHNAADGLETDRGSESRKEEMKALGSSGDTGRTGLRERRKDQLKLSPSKRDLWALKEAETGRWTDKQIGAGCLLPICPYLCIALPVRKVPNSVVQILHIFFV